MPVATQGMSLTVRDYLHAYVLEWTLHHLDLIAHLDPADAPAGPPAEGLAEARDMVERRLRLRLPEGGPTPTRCASPPGAASPPTTERAELEARPACGDAAAVAGVTGPPQPVTAAASRAVSGTAAGRSTVLAISTRLRRARPRAPVHHLEHVLAELAGGPQALAAHRHVLQPSAPGLLVAAGHRQGLPALAAERVQLHVPVEAVRVRDGEVPAVPWTSIGCAEVATASKLITSVDSTPTRAPARP